MRHISNRKVSGHKPIQHMQIIRNQLSISYKFPTLCMKKNLTSSEEIGDVL